jgi:hypothetical protein
MNMSFVSREINKLRSALDVEKMNAGDIQHREIYAALQALEWAIDPSAIKSPFNFILQPADYTPLETSNPSLGLS